MAKNVLDKKFFKRSPLIVARRLLGKNLVLRSGVINKNFVICDVEAYLGEFDLASHARFGKTKRNAVMWQEPGIFYVYLIWGMYFMLNIVCEKEGKAGAVLIRGVWDVERKIEISGPGRVGKVLGIDMGLNGKEVGKESGLWIEEAASDTFPKINIYKRVGVGYAKEWADKPWRFSIKV